MSGKTKLSAAAPAGRSRLANETINQRIAAAQAAGANHQQSLAFAHSLVDGLGRSLDPEMVMPIAALHYLQLPTTASCQGHRHDQRPGAYAFPWIDFPAPIDHGQFLLSELSLWTIVQRGTDPARSYRLNPREITAINDTRYDHLDYQHWQPARQQLAAWAEKIIAPDDQR